MVQIMYIFIFEYNNIILFTILCAMTIFIIMMTIPMMLYICLAYRHYRYLDDSCCTSNNIFINLTILKIEMDIFIYTDAVFSTNGYLLRQ